MNETSNSYSHTTDIYDNIASDSVAAYGSQPQMMEHLRYQGVETLMKINDLSSLRILVPKIQKLYFYTIQENKTSENIERLLKTIDVISNYEDNWDDEDSPAIVSDIIDFIRDVVNNTNDYLLEHWSIFPSNNGTLKLEIHQPQVNAGINIGVNDFSYYIHFGADEIYGRSTNTRKHIINILTQVYYGE